MKINGLAEKVSKKKKNPDSRSEKPLVQTNPSTEENSPGDNDHCNPAGKGQEGEIPYGSACNFC